MIGKAVLFRERALRNCLPDVGPSMHRIPRPFVLHIANCLTFSSFKWTHPPHFGIGLAIRPAIVLILQKQTVR